MGIGPDSGEEANRIWTYVEQEKMNLEDLISNYKVSGQLSGSQLNRLVKDIRLPLAEEKGGILTMTLLDGMPLNINPQAMAAQKHDALINILKSEEFNSVPLKAKDKIIGVLLADNPYTHKPITNDDIRVLTMFANQAGLAIENSQLYEKTLLKSHSDSLTGLWNHGYFQYRLQEEINIAKEAQHPLCVIMADLDNFKTYNDMLGHREGDQLLVQIAKLLTLSARKQDSIYRYGGEEFAILLMQTTKSEAYIIAERIRLTVEKYNFPHEQTIANKKLTVSLGVAVFPGDAESKELLLEHADKALYAAKHQGKNRICG